MRLKTAIVIAAVLASQTAHAQEEEDGRGLPPRFWPGVALAAVGAAVATWEVPGCRFPGGGATMTWPEWPGLTVDACYETPDGLTIAQPGGPNPMGPTYPPIPAAETMWVPRGLVVAGVGLIGAGALMALWPAAPVDVEASPDRVTVGRSVSW